MKDFKPATTFCPGHITGFFDIYNKNKDHLHIGSRGVGICLNQGVLTQVEIRPSLKSRVEILIDGQSANNAVVSQKVVKIFCSLFSNKLDVKVKHRFNIPIGCGFGTSGAGALSLALAMNRVLGVFNTDIEASQIAHIAEIKCKTGLGSVLAQTQGGLVIRKKPGAPKIGIAQSFPVNNNYRIVCLVLGKLPTKKMLSNNKLKGQINKYGLRARIAFLKSPTVEAFLLQARKFAHTLGFMSNRIAEIIDIADKSGFVCSQAMFGETVFTIVKSNDVSKLIKIFKLYAKDSAQIIIAKPDHLGARVL